MKALRFYTVLLGVVFLASCKLQIIVPEGGSVTTASGAYNCESGEVCNIDVVDFFFDQTFTAKPASGYSFKHWKKAHRRFCANDTKPCHVYTIGLNSNEEIAKIMATFFDSEEVFYLQPVFERVPEDVETPCGRYPDPSTSLYVLPFKVGESYALYQGNCGPFSHFLGTSQQFAYDFIMPIGAEVVAMRSGVVNWLVERHDTNSKPNDRNLVEITHDDNTRSYYWHLAQNGVLVSIGDVVEQGQVIGLSGHSGSVSPVAHLHVGLRDLSDFGASKPFTFRNISPSETDLTTFMLYKALQY